LYFADTRRSATKHGAIRLIFQYRAPPGRKICMFHRLLRAGMGGKNVYSARTAVYYTAQRVFFFRLLRD
jgi:hypothetical protein